MRSVGLIARAGVAFVLYRLVLHHVRQPLWAALPAALVLVCLDEAPVRWEPHPGWPSTLCGVVTAWCLARPSPGRRWIAAAGAAAGLTFAFKQNAGVFVIGAVLAYPLLARRICGPQRIPLHHAFGLALVSFGLVTLAWLVPLVVALGGNVANMGVLIGMVAGGGLFSAPEPEIVTALVCLAGGFWLVRQKLEGPARMGPAWLLTCGIALFLTEFPRMDNVHLMWSIPLLAAVGAIVLDHLQPRLALALLANAVALAWPNIADRADFLTLPRAPLEGIEAPVTTVEDLRGLTLAVDARTAAGEPIFVYPTSPLIYVLADRPNPTRFDHLNPGALSPADVDRVIKDLEAAQPRLIVISDFWTAFWGAPGPNSVLEDWITAHYPIAIGQYGAYRVLVDPAYNAR